MNSDPSGVSHTDDLSQVAPLAPESGLCGGPGQMSCEDANEMIQMVLDHLSDSDGEQLFNEHMGECPPCESEFVVYQRIVASLVRTRPAMPDEAFARLMNYCEGIRADSSESLATVNREESDGLI